jgi:hypothetical protein
MREHVTILGAQLISGCLLRYGWGKLRFRTLVYTD